MNNKINENCKTLNKFPIIKRDLHLVSHDVRLKIIIIIFNIIFNEIFNVILNLGNGKF